MRILFADEQRRVKLPLAQLRRLARTVLAREGWPARTISIAFVDNRRIRAINREFLDHDYATDVISFRLDERDAEIVISTEVALAEASKRRIPVEEEIRRYVVHGLLHLVGYDDGTPAQRRVMWAKQEGYLVT